MTYDADAMALLIPRPELVESLLSELQDKPFLALTGPRGAGKTTMLSAPHFGISVIT